MDKLIANIDALFKLLSDSNHEKINTLQESKSDLRNNKNINNILSLCKDESIQALDKKLTDETIGLLDKQLANNIISNTCESFDVDKIPDDVFELCLKILEHPKYKFTIKTKDEKVCFSSNVVGVCRNEWTVAKMLESLNNNEESIFKESNSELSFKSANYICDGCNHSMCPKTALCILSYYKDNGQLEQIIESRAGGIKFFNYEWNPEDGLKEVPEDIYQMAIKMVDNNQIGLSRELNKNVLDVKMSYSCANMRDILTTDDLDKLEPYKFGKWKNFGRDVSKKIIDGNCKNLSCRKAFCPFVVAAYIYYLRMTNQENIITADRMYYFENENEILEKVRNIYDEKSKDTEAANNKKEIQKVFEPFKLTITNIDLLVDTISNNIQKNLYCVIEKESGIKNDLINEVVNALRKTEKIIKKEIKTKENTTTYTKDVEYMNMSSFAAKLVVPLPNTFDKFGDFKSNDVENHVLYVLDGINEFLDMQESFDKALAVQQYSEIRKKQIAKLIEFLCGMQNNKYVILQGTKAEIDKLLGLDSRLKYIYNNFRLSTKNLSVDELFEIYRRKLEPDVFDILVRAQEDKKKVFADYISNNRMLVPFKNEELATYLASYSNAKGDVILPPDVYKKQTLEESLKEIVGLDSIKEKIKELEKYTVFYNKTRSLGLNMPSNSLHMIFTGNPGCGKTTIARIMAKMLFDIGMIKENKLVEVERKDLVAEYIGQTAVKTSKVIDEAMGGVLFVDEAYSLTPSDSFRDFGQEAIATLIKAMEDHKDNLVVIFAGYKNEMKHFVDSNPGISSRIGYKFDFPDYSAKELTEIFKIKAAKSGFVLGEKVLEEVNLMADFFVKKKSFGNGRFVDRLLQETLINHAKNMSEDLLTLVVDDLPSLEAMNHEHSERNVSTVALENIIGLTELKTKLVEFEDYVSFVDKAKRMGLKIPNNNMHMLFRGNPGTGKTTVARIVAQMLYDMGVLHENKLIETEKKDFIGQYKGETSIKTAEVIDKALGGVLFIDEAYGLSPTHASDPAHEAIAALIKAMEDNKGNLVVIFAGYKEEMSGFVGANPGIASRLGYIFDFEDYSSDELCQIFDIKMKKAGMVVEDGVHELVEKIMKYFCDVKNFGNGRFVDKLIQEILMNHAKNKSEKIEIISKTDIPSIKEMISCVFSDRDMINPETITEDALRRTAIHEIGHAFVRYKLFSTPNIKKITINADGSGTLGCVEMNPTYKATKSKKELMNQIKVSLAGMASEKVFTGEFENGNTSDLKKSTNIAYNMITKYGMSDIGFGQIFDTSAEMGVLIQNEINKILRECYNDAEKILTEDKEQIMKLVDYLLEHKEIDEEQFLSQL